MKPTMVYSGPMGRLPEHEQFCPADPGGYSAVKAVDNSIRVIVHVSNGFDNSLSRWVFDGLKSFGASGTSSVYHLSFLANWTA